MGIRKYRGQIVVDKRWPDGSRITRRCQNRTKAKELLVQIEHSIANGTWREQRDRLQLRNRGQIRLAEYAETYIKDYAQVRNKRSSWRRKMISLKALKQHLGNLELSSITPAHLHRYVQKRKNAGVSNATINRDLTTLKHMLTYASETGLIQQSPVEKFRPLVEDFTTRPRFSDDQVQAVIDAMRPECRPIFIFVRETGCRREEVLSLRHWQVQKESRLVLFNEDTKSRKYRYAPLTDAALEAVETLPPLEGCLYVFYNPSTGRRWHDCRKPWVEARTSAEVPELQVKDLRRLYAIKLAEADAEMHDIQQVLGHASVRTTERHYAQFSPRNSARKIFSVLQGNAVEVETKRKQA